MKDIMIQNRRGDRPIVGNHSVRNTLCNRPEYPKAILRSILEQTDGLLGSIHLSRNVSHTQSQ